MGITTEAWDVILQDDYVYAANASGTWCIIRLTKDLTSPINYGTNNNNITVEDFSPGHFYGPRRFTAIKPEKFVIIDDEDNIAYNFNKIVSMDDMLGTNWTTFPTSGDGTSYFDLYVTC